MHDFVQTHIFAKMPPNAIVGGVECDGHKIYIGRAEHKGDILPLKIIPGKKKAFVSWDGKEIQKMEFEVSVELISCV